MFKRRRDTLTDITELNDLLAADSAGRAALLADMSESVAKGLLLYMIGVMTRG